MTGEQWKSGRHNAGLTQVAAARLLKVTQPYLSQLETGLRVAGPELVRKAIRRYRLPPTALPISKQLDVQVSPGDLQREIASLGYPGFEHVRFKMASNPAEVVSRALLRRDLDTRLVEALPWVLSMYTGLNWEWLRDRTKLQNAQNRLGYVVHLATETARALPDSRSAVRILSRWREELEDARLAREGTLCRDSMPEAERMWLRANRPEAAAHWSLLTSLTAGQLPYATH